MADLRNLLPEFRDVFRHEAVCREGVDLRGVAHRLHVSDQLIKRTETLISDRLLLLDIDRARLKHAVDVGAIEAAYHISAGACV